MARRSARVQELREKREFNCVSGLFSVHQGCASPQLIPNGGPANKLIVDCSRKLDRRTSFDEECRKIQYEADMESGERSLRDLIREDMYIRKKKNKKSAVKGLKWTKTDTKFVDHQLETGKAARRKSQKAYQSSLCNLNNSSSLIHQQPSTSADMSSDKLSTAAELGTECSQNHREKVKLSEGFERSVLLEKHDHVAKNMEQAQMSAQAFADQMFADRKIICKEGTRIKSRPFSDALEVLNSDKDLNMEVLSESNYKLEKCIKNLHTSQFGKETVKSVPDGKQFLKKVDHQFQYSSKTSLTGQQSNKTVILKEEPQNRKYSGKFACHCSSRQSPDGLSSRELNGKLRSFSVAEIKKKLKYTFGGTRREPNQLSLNGTPSKLSHSRPIFGDDCIYRGVQTMNPLRSSTTAKTKEKLGKKQGLKPEREPDIARDTGTVRKKIDVSSVRFSKKHGADAVFDAKRHLSAKLEAIGTTSERSPRTLERIISSLEHDSWPVSPRQDSQHCSGSVQMRFSSYRTSHTPNGKQRTCLSAVRTNTEFTPYDDTTEILSTETTSSMTPSTDEEAQDTMSSPTANVKSSGEPKIVETNNILYCKAQNDINSTMQRPDKFKLHAKDGSKVHPISDALSDNETFTNTVDDFPYTPTSIHQLDTPDNIKYQEEHQSPVSVLDQIFAEDANSPSSIMLQTARDPLKPRCLRFEECSFESSPQDYISHYVHLVFQSSSLSWDQISRIRPVSEELLHSSLFDEVGFLLSDSDFNTRLLFDHMNEVLLQIQRSHFLSSPLSAVLKPRICSLPLEKVVFDEIMREADFYLLPRTQTRTLDQLVAKDVADCRLWLDMRTEAEHIVAHISEDILVESILDVILEFGS